MPLAPTVIPGRANERIVRKSRLLFHWRAADLSLMPVTGETPTFVRATAGGMVADRAGNLRNVAQYQPRFEMVDLDGDGVRETPGLLLEGQRSNLCAHSQDLNGAGWGTAGAGTLVITDNYLMLGDLALSHLVLTGGNKDLYRTDVTLAGGTESFRLFVRGDGTACAFTAKLSDSGSTNRLVIAIGVTVGGVVTAVASTGSVLAVTLLGNGVYEILCAAPSCAAGTGGVAAFSAAGACSVILGGPQIEDAAFSSSCIKTTSAPATRNADAPSWPVLFSPQALTVQLRFLNACPSSVGQDVVAIGGGANRLEFYSDGATWILRNVVAAAVASSTTGANTHFPPSYGSAMASEATIAYGADGVLALYDGDALAAGPSAAGAIPAAWSYPAIHPGTLYTSEYGPGRLTLLSLKVAAGLKTPAQVREMF